MVRVRVLHVITRLIVGGAQENTMLTAALLDKQRYDVAVLSGPQTGPEGSLQEEVRARGVPLTILPELVREVSPLKDALALWKLYRFIKSGNYDIIHTHSSKAGILGRWAAYLAGVPVIVHTVHGWGHHDRQHPLVRWYFIQLERITAHITDTLIVVSPRNTEKGLRDGIGHPGLYVTIRSGIELDRFLEPGVSTEEARQSLGLPAEAPVVGTVTRLSPQKAPLDFVRLAAQVAEELPETRFVVVGDGPLRPQVEEAIAATGLSGRMLLTGLRRDVPRLLRAFDVFVLTSLWEGLPRVLPQAMAAGLPIVATAVDGNAEAVTDGVNGYLVPPGDVSGMAQQVMRLLRDPALARRMGAAGRERVPEFGARKMVAEIAALYEELLARQS